MTFGLQIVDIAFDRIPSKFVANFDHIVENRLKTGVNNHWYLGILVTFQCQYNAAAASIALRRISAFLR